MAEIITRRSFLRVLTGLIAAPAVIQFTSLMPLRGETLIVPAQPAILVSSSTFEITGFARTGWGAEWQDGVYKYLDGQWPAEALKHA